MASEAKVDTNKSYIERKALSLFNIHIEDLYFLCIGSQVIKGQTYYSVGSYTPKNGEHEVYLCNLWIDSAYDRVCEAFKWHFLTDLVFFEEIDRSELVADYGYRFAYKIKTPYDEETEEVKKRTLINICSIYSGKDRRNIVNFKKIGNIIYCNDKDLHGSATYKINLEAKNDKEILTLSNSQNPVLYYTLKENGCPSEFIDLIAYQLALLIAPSIAPKDTQLLQLIAQQYNLANEALLKKECYEIKRFSNEEVE